MSDAGIISQINYEKVTYGILMGENPKYLYLGLKECFELSEELQDFVVYEDSSESFKQSYDGMEIIRLHKKSHLAVS